nr:hypothetical protein Q903MT_gene3248 [Picea sitchensis]
MGATLERRHSRLYKNKLFIRFNECRSGVGRYSSCRRCSFRRKEGIRRSIFMFQWTRKCCFMGSAFNTYVI